MPEDLNSCNFVQHRNFIYLFLGKQSQKFPKTLGRLVIDCFLPKLLVIYGTTQRILHNHAWPLGKSPEGLQMIW